MHRVGKIWEDLCSLIIRPQRAVYTVGQLGPKVFRLDTGHTVYERTDIQIENPRGFPLECSWYSPAGLPAGTKLPVVIYCHGNCGCRRDAFECVETLLPLGVTVFAFDFCGSGMSGGDWVTLGFYERQDLAAVVEHVQGSGKVSAVGLWGRSMGAVASIMYASKDKSVQAVVADSPFSSLYQIMLDLVLGYKSWIPKAAVDLTVSQMRRSILSRAEFDIYDLEATKYAAQCDAPALICHGIQDNFVAISHSHAVKASYRGEVTLHEVSGDHNAMRPVEFLEDAGKFFRKQIGQPVLVVVKDSQLRTTLMARLATMELHVLVARELTDLANAFTRQRRFGLIVTDEVLGASVVEYVRRHAAPHVASQRIVQMTESDTDGGHSGGEEDEFVSLYDGYCATTAGMNSFMNIVNSFYRMW